MAADVSTLHRVLSGYKDDLAVGNESVGEKSTALITKDLLGAGSGGSALIDTKNDQSLELDFDVHVPNGWEKRLDLKSGKVYLQRCNSANSSSSSDVTKHQTNQTVTNLQGLNFPASPLSSSKPLLNLFDESSLELKLVSSSSKYQSVCTLDKVKFALEKFQKEPIKKRTSPSALWKSPLSPSYSSSSSSIKNSPEGELGEEKLASPVATGCPGCLSYVLIMKHNPKCPRCNTFVPIMSVAKKPRIDLNISI